MTATWITYETGTLGAAVGAPDSNAFASASSTAVYDATHVLNGSQSLKITPAASTIAESRVVTGLNTTMLAVTVPFWYTTAKTADEGILRIEDTTGARMLGVTWNASGRLSVTDRSGTSPRLYVNGTAQPPMNQWCVIKLWLQLGASATTGSVKYGLYTSSGAVINTASGGVDSPFTTSAANLGTLNIDRLWVGRDGAQAATDARWYDTVGYDPAATDVLANYTTSSPVGGSSTVNDNQAQIIVTGFGGTSPYTYAISQTGGPTTTPVNTGTGQWLVPKNATTDLTYNVTITDSASGTAPVSVTVPHIQGAGGTLRYFDGVQIISL